MRDYVYLTIKYGSNDFLDSRMVVDYTDMDEWGFDRLQEAAHFSQHHRTVYQVVKVPRSWNYKEYIKTKSILIRGEDETSDIRQKTYTRSAVLDIDELARKVKDSDLRSKIAGPMPQPIIDVREHGITEAIMLDVEATPRERSTDFNAVTSGTHTVGTSKDYATWAAYVGDVGALTGDIEGQQQTDTTETAQSYWNVTQGAHDASFTTDTSHGGDVTAGWVSTATYTADHLFEIVGTRSGNFTVDGLHFKYGATPAGLIYMFDCVISDNVLLKNCYADGDGRANTSFFRGTDSSSVSAVVANCMIWDVDYGVVSIQDGYVYDNCTVLNAGQNGIHMNNTARTGVVRSCGSYNATGNDYWRTNNMTKNNLASSDATADGTAPQANLTTANEIYTTDTNANFLHPLEGATVATNGNTTHTVSTDAAGVTWDGSDPSIGAFQYTAAASGFGGLLSTQRNRLVL